MHPAVETGGLEPEHVDAVSPGDGVPRDPEGVSGRPWPRGERHPVAGPHGRPLDLLVDFTVRIGQGVDRLRGDLSESVTRFDQFPEPDRRLHVSPVDVVEAVAGYLPGTGGHFGDLFSSHDIEGADARMLHGISLVVCAQIAR